MNNLKESLRKLQTEINEIESVDNFIYYNPVVNHFFYKKERGSIELFNLPNEVFKTNPSPQDIILELKELHKEGVVLNFRHHESDDLIVKEGYITLDKILNIYYPAHAFSIFKFK